NPDVGAVNWVLRAAGVASPPRWLGSPTWAVRSEEHTSELQSLTNLVCRLLLEKKKKKIHKVTQRNDAMLDSNGSQGIWGQDEERDGKHRDIRSSSTIVNTCVFNTLVWVLRDDT